MGQILNIVKPCYSMATIDGQKAEIILYGEIVEHVPLDWWTGEPEPGPFIALDEFLEDLESLGSIKELTVRLNTYGGDAAVSILIHNRLRDLTRDGVNVICIVDGAAMSGGSIIMCAADDVRVNPSSLIMIHKAWTYIYGGYNADELREIASANDTYDRAMASIYERKTKLSEEKIMAMMGETTYMTGREAVELGFANALIEDAEPLSIAASADGTRIMCKGRSIRLPAGMYAPDMIPTETDLVSKVEGPDDKNPEDSGTNSEERRDDDMTINSLEDLKREFPEYCHAIEAESSENARKAERTRLAEIDAIASLYDESMVQEARYGENACSAQELAYRAAMESAKRGEAFAKALEADAEESGVNDVPEAQAPEDEPDKPLTPAEKKAKADLEVKRIFNKT